MPEPCRKDSSDDCRISSSVVLSGISSPNSDAELRRETRERQRWALVELADHMLQGPRLHVLGPDPLPPQFRPPDMVTATGAHPKA